MLGGESKRYRNRSRKHQELARHRRRDAGQPCLIPGVGLCLSSTLPLRYSQVPEDTVPQVIRDGLGAQHFPLPWLPLLFCSIMKTYVLSSHQISAGHSVDQKWILKRPDELASSLSACPHRLQGRCLEGGDPSQCRPALGSAPMVAVAGRGSTLLSVL